MSVFIDSSIWFSAIVTKDTDNGRAKAVLRQAKAPFTTDHVIVETWLLLNSRHGRRTAEAFSERVRMGAIRIVFVTPADLDAAWLMGEAFPDQDFSIVDCTSFAVMERLGVKQAASFDHHFAVYRFGPRRDQAFEILR